MEKHIPITIFELKDLRDALSKLTELIKYFQENLEDSINLSKLTSISQSLKESPLDELVIPGRKFVREGELLVLEILQDERKAYRFFLFSDLLYVF